MQNKKQKSSHNRKRSHSIHHLATTAVLQHQPFSAGAAILQFPLKEGCVPPRGSVNIFFMETRNIKGVT